MFVQACWSFLCKARVSTRFSVINPAQVPLDNNWMVQLWSIDVQGRLRTSESMSTSLSILVDLSDMAILEQCNAAIGSGKAEKSADV